MATTFKPPCDEAVIRARPATAPCSPAAGPWVLAATILGSSMAFIDGTVVNVALPALQRDLGATVVEIQWVVEAYALLLAALDQWPEAGGLGVDRSAAALSVARGNADALGFGARAAFLRGDWADAIDARFDLILCNPPYVETGAALAPQVADHEPASALYAGADGLDDYKRLVPQLSRLLAPHGLAALEIGAGQRAAVSALVEGEGLVAGCRKDLGNRDRCITVTRPSD